MLFSEYIGKGHIDMVCDTIAEEIYAYCIHEDPDARVAIEVSATSEIILIFGELTINEEVERIPYEDIVDEILAKAMYTKEYYDPTIVWDVKTQSPNIAQRVDEGEYIGFGDTNVAYGRAVNYSMEFMPIEYLIARECVEILEDYAISNPNTITFDTKVMVAYDETKQEIIDIFIACQCLNKSAKRLPIYDMLERELNNSGYDVSKKNIRIDFYEREERISDSGTTGRKTAVNCYGIMGKMDGGSLNGKDLTKGDKIGKFIARYIAVNIICADLCNDIEVYVHCTMGAIWPTIEVVADKNTELIDKVVQKVFGKKRLNYYMHKFASYRVDANIKGYFGKMSGRPWEVGDKLGEIWEVLEELKC